MSNRGHGADLHGDLGRRPRPSHQPRRKMTIATLLEWVSTRWRRATAVPERQTSAVPLQRSKSVPPEYQSLSTYLEHRYASTVVLTFEQMEALLGFALPERAHVERDWWTGAASGMDHHAHAWAAAGRTAMPNLPARTVAFERSTRS